MLGGQCANSLTDVYDFMVRLKDLDLNGWEYSECNCNNEQVPAGCEVRCDSDSGNTMADTCLWDYCFSFDDILTMMASIKSDFANDILGRYATYGVGSLFLYFGIGNELPESLDALMSVMAVLAPTVVGSLAAARTAVMTVQNTIRATDFTEDNIVGLTWFSYGGHSFAGDLLGILEGFWAVAFFVLAGTFAYLPYDLAYKIDADWQARGDTAIGFTHLTYGLALSIAIEGAAWLLELENEDLLTFFDITDEDDLDPQAQYEELFGVAPTVNNGLSVFLDLAHHSVVLVFYYAIAATLSAGSYYYVSRALTDSNQ